MSLALACFISRITIRIYTRRRLYLDDGFLCLAAASLCASTVYIYQYCFLWFLMNAAQKYPELALTTAFVEGGYPMALEKSPRFRNTYSVLIWITVFSIKFSFLAFFKPLIRHLRLTTIYCWISVTFTLIALVSVAQRRLSSTSTQTITITSFPTLGTI